MVRPCGPAAREFPLFLIACETISGEKREFPLDNLDVWVAEMQGGENCLAKAVAIFSLRVRDLEEKMMG